MSKKHYNRAQHQHGAQHYQPPASKGGSPPTVYAVKIESGPDDENRYVEEKTYREDQLRVLKDQVAKARTLNKVSGIGSVIALAALIALILNARLVHSQLRAARHANKISNNSLIVSQRAFVFVPSDFTEQSGIDDKTREKIGVFTFKMENSGNTPGTITGNHISTNYTGPWDKLQNDFGFPDLNSASGPFPNSENVNGKIVIAPHQDWQFIPLAVRQKLFPLINSGKAHVYFWGWMTYTDVFGCSHKTEFARQLVSVQGNTFFLDNLSKHNCIDRNCSDYNPPNNPACPN